MPRTFIPLVFIAAAIPAHAAFKCTDPKGVSHYEDVPPAACADVVIQEVSPSGRVLRTMEPRKAPAAPVEPAKKMESDRAALDRQRRDRTLLDTFADEREIDTARDRSLDLMRGRKQSAESQLELVKKRRKQLEANKSARKSDVEAAAKEQASIEHVIAGYDAEMDRVKQQFETDTVRWRELRAASPRR
jgi:hypothetical protein